MAALAQLSLKSSTAEESSMNTGFPSIDVTSSEISASEALSVPEPVSNWRLWSKVTAVAAPTSSA